MSDLEFIRLDPGSEHRCWADTINARGELDQCDRTATHVECQLKGETRAYWCSEHTEQRIGFGKPKTDECDCEGEVDEGRWVVRRCAACRAREEAE
jgi:hypothetical protein